MLFHRFHKPLVDHIIINFESESMHGSGGIYCVEVEIIDSRIFRSFTSMHEEAFLPIGCGSRGSRPTTCIRFIPSFKPLPHRLCVQCETLFGQRPRTEMPLWIRPGLTSKYQYMFSYHRTRKHAPRRWFLSFGLYYGPYLRDQNIELCQTHSHFSHQS